LKLKAKDSKRFCMIFLILSTYVYMGAVNNTYITPASDGLFLFYLSLVLIGIGLLFFYRYNKIKTKIKEMSADEE
ncbi:MAG TPA: YrhC family protein, partial [Virgibacillus sp.]|nr:YrhC family protein [Virgibacillus sp.]